MQNYSLNGEAVSFYTPSNRLIVVDILYLSEVSEYVSEIVAKRKSVAEKIADIESQAFPYGDGNILGYIENSTGHLFSLKVSDIKKAAITSVQGDESEIEYNVPVFSTDSGVIAIVDFNFFELFCKSFQYDELLEVEEHTYGTINLSHLNSISTSIGGEYFCIISTPGVDKGFDFDGSGSYFIDRGST